MLEAEAIQPRQKLKPKLRHPKSQLADSQTYGSVYRMIRIYMLSQGITFIF